MMRRIQPPTRRGDPLRRSRSVLVGWALAGAGLVAGAVALALPWARYTVEADVAQAGTGVHRAGGAPVYQLAGGTWCLFALLGAAGLVAVAATATGPARRAVGASAALLGPLAAVLPLRLAGRIGASSGTVIAQGFVSMTADATPAPGLWFGAAAPVLLGFGAALVGLSTPPSAPAQDQAGWRRERGSGRREQL
jgi:hypothetical protein